VRQRGWFTVRLSGDVLKVVRLLNKVRTSGVVQSKPDRQPVATHFIFAHGYDGSGPKTTVYQSNPPRNRGGLSQHG
jgi:hypothetical protein